MCGIAGISRLGGQLDHADVTAVERMVTAQYHRGPDDGGTFHDGEVALGHRRLSIIDVSSDGHQPMKNETGTVWVTYNGEIYNYQELRRVLVAAGHQFQSRSDTEVLIHGYEEWGEEGLLSRLRGMFAFGLYDATRRRIILARDRLGIKPLYYFFDQKTGWMGFASEVKALLASGLIAKDANREALAGFLLMGSVPAPLTMYRDVNCLLPGHYLAAEANTVRIQRYWDLTFNASSVDCEQPLSDVLRDAVSRHLVSDVPLGIFLSGGLDSAGLVALARADQARLKTLTISFADLEFDEAAEARDIASHFGTEHHELRISGDDFDAELPRIIAAMDQPTNDGVNSYFVAKAAREAGLTVVLSGLGGDELFFGYRHYHWMARNSRTLAAFDWAPGPLRKACLAAAVAYGRLTGREAWMRLSSLDSGLSAEGLYMAFRGFFPPAQVQELLGNSRANMDQLVAENLERIHSTANGTHPNRVNYIEVKRYLHDQLLRDTDAFSMAHSVEVRVPYLDDEVVRLAAALPTRQKTNRLMNKPMLADAIGDSVVFEAARRKKRGFSFPLGRWMRERTGQMREIALQTNSLERATVGKLWSAFEDGRLHWSRAWSLVVLGART